MVWFKVDDGLVGNKKFAKIPRPKRMAAAGLWVTLGSWCSGELTDGFVPAYMVAEVGGTATQARDLVAVGLWSEIEGGFQFANWYEWQPTRAAVEAERELAKERQQRARDKAKQAREEDGVTPASRRDDAVSHGGSHAGVTPVVTVPPTRPDPTLISPTEKGAQKRATRLPDGWIPPEPLRIQMAKERPDLNIRLEHENFCDYWKAKGGRDAAKLDWPATWRKWMRNARSTQGGKPLQAVPTYEAPTPPPMESYKWDAS